MNKIQKVQPVILCGGSGARLWPLSRAGFPKQFLSLTGDESLFQQAALRLSAVTGNEIDVVDPIVVTGEEHRFLASEQLREIGVKMHAAILEPSPRNTAPALTMAALASIAGGDDPILIVTPADQAVANDKKFNAAISSAVNAAIDGSVIILGVKPSRSETGYGYVRASEISDTDCFKVEEFVEKPDKVKAQAFLDNGGYYWNAGIFVMRASVWLKALKKFRPDMSLLTEVAWNERTEDQVLGNRFLRPNGSLFSSVPSKSIDHAVMELCPGSSIPIHMIEIDAGWSDLGAWDAVWANLSRDLQGNACKGDVVSIKSENSLVYASSRLVTLLGVKDLVVVETPDAILVTTRENAQNVNAIVQSLQAKGREEAEAQRKVQRPWGWYDSIEQGDGFKVKRIYVNPGSSLSLQKHQHRAEHWVVVSGTAEVTNGEQVSMLSENQSTYIPRGAVHRLANPTKAPLEIIEVQSGSYLGEDDIVRLGDKYGRDMA